ncbi:uncharacterized protein LOC144328650 [Podarcis muralis]
MEPHQLPPSRERTTLVPRSLLTSCLCKLHPLPPVRKEESPHRPLGTPQPPSAATSFQRHAWTALSHGPSAGRPRPLLSALHRGCSLAGFPSAAWTQTAAQTTFSPSPTKEAPLSLGELLSWFSEVSKSWRSSAGGPEAAADAAAFPPLLSPTKRCWMSISTSFPVAADLVPQCWGKWDSTEDPGRPFPPPFAAAAEQLAGAAAGGQGPVRRGQG